MAAEFQVTEKAREKLMEMEVTREQFLRLWVGEGGCSGLSYQAVLDGAQTPFDQVLFEDDEIKIVCDKNSSSYLGGVTIDYSDDLMNSGFRFLNPNAVKTCGCGSSFTA